MSLIQNQFVVYSPIVYNFHLYLPVDFTNGRTAIIWDGSNILYVKFEADNESILRRKLKVSVGFGSKEEENYTLNVHIPHPTGTNIIACHLTQVEEILKITLDSATFMLISPQLQKVKALPIYTTFGITETTIFPNNMDYRLDMDFTACQRGIAFTILTFSSLELFFIVENDGPKMKVTFGKPKITSGHAEDVLLFPVEFDSSMRKLTFIITINTNALVFGIYDESQVHRYHKRFKYSPSLSDLDAKCTFTCEYNDTISIKAYQTKLLGPTDEAWTESERSAMI